MQVLDAHHPERAAHREVLDQRAAFVEFGIQVGDREAGQPRPERQIRGGRIGGMQPDEIGRHAADRRRVLTQEMPPRKSGPPLVDRE